MSSSLPEGMRLRVTAGSPTTQEIAALVAALAAGPSLPGSAAAATPAEAPAWARAARREAVGGPAAAAPADLRGPIRRR